MARKAAGLSMAARTWAKGVMGYPPEESPKTLYKEFAVSKQGWQIKDGKLVHITPEQFPSKNRTALPLESTACDAVSFINNEAAHTRGGPPRSAHQPTHSRLRSYAKANLAAFLETPRSWRERLRDHS